ncbi:MAG: class I SAM-dependent methyltransferase [Gammaproteobacteria bacterium]|nr:class I SAM-dependent methyltransferase [Gammaproteobacteria bacterium]MBU1655121.1 class I SAM-dependent methyltransferase [Gammaproteobacteria bacterium]MBU1961593.1 class I SAM-dependent methyltransferase [Gammaproteobacteria bacterium]
MNDVIEPRIHDPNAYFEATELEVMGRVLPLKGATALELGCGRAWMTRRLAEDFQVARIVATEVDRIQHEKNLAIADLPQVEFRYGGMEAIDLPEGSVDLVLMLKSLHHVPAGLMDRGFAEIHRVLKPGGLAYISEPVYAGAFNEILRLFNDEQRVREAAFAAVRRAVEGRGFEFESELFFESPGCYMTWEEFEDRMLKVTHTRHEIGPELHGRIQTAFMAHMTPEGACFKKPSRVDLLRKA